MDGKVVITKVGRVQGGGIFFSKNASAATVDKSAITPTSIIPMVGDVVFFPNGDIRPVTAVKSGSIECGAAVANVTGPKGNRGEKGDPAEITNELGYRDDLAVSQKLLTEQLGNISTVLASLVDVTDLTAETELDETGELPSAEQEEVTEPNDETVLAAETESADATDFVPEVEPAEVSEAEPEDEIKSEEVAE